MSNKPNRKRVKNMEQRRLNNVADYMDKHANIKPMAVIIAELIIRGYSMDEIRKGHRIFVEGE